MSSVVELRLEQSTPAFTGHFRPEVVDRTYYLRPQSLKGVWRWLARAVVAGAMYDLGYLCGEARDGLKRPTKRETRAISRIVGKVMGLGYADPSGRESEASRFALRVEVIREPRVRSARTGSIYFRGRQVRLQRLQLLTMTRGGAKRELQYFEGGAFRLIVTRVASRDREGEELALRTLVLALSLLGVGKGSRRGLGSFDVVNVRGLYVERDPYSFLNRTYDTALRVVKRHLGETGVAPCSERGLPPLPSICKGSHLGMHAFSLYRVEASWADVHDFFLRSERCKRLTGSYKGTDKLRRDLEAWVLGLPRSQRGTGYVAESVDRRASPILVAAHGLSLIHI